MNDLFPECLAEALRDAAVHLAIDDQGIDDAPDVVNAYITADSDIAGVPLHLGNHDVRAEGKGEIGWLPEVRDDESGLGIRWELLGVIGGRGDFVKGDRFA